MAATPRLPWFDQLPCSVTVCDTKYRILYLNDRSAELNAADGGKLLVGKNLLDCHPPKARAKLRRVMKSGRPNVYTTEKNGVRKVICQSHWKKHGKVAGLVEIAFEFPFDAPHFLRT